MEDIGLKKSKKHEGITVAYETTDKQKKGFLSGLYH